MKKRKGCLLNLYFYGFIFLCLFSFVILVRLDILRPMQFAWLWDDNTYQVQLNAQQALEQANRDRALDIQSHFTLATKLIIWFFSGSIILLFLSLSVILTLLGFKKVSLIQPKDGIYPLIIPVLDQIKGLLPTPHQLTVINPNKSLLPASTYNQDHRGMVEYGESHYGDQAQITAAQIFSNVQASAAIAASTGKPTASMIKAAHTVGEIQDLPFDIEATETLPPVDILTPQNYITQASKSAGKIPLGQDDLGNMAYWESKAARQIAIFGANLTGKTSSVATGIVYVCCKWGYHVIALDPKRGVDWGVFGNNIERHNSDAETMGDQLGQIIKHMEVRAEVLQHYHVQDFYQLSTQQIQHNNIPPMLVVIEELGDIRTSAEGYETLDQIDAHLSTLLRVSRYTGIHLLLIDQRWINWPKIVKANVKSTLTFKQGINQGAAVGYYNAHVLKDQGEFAYEDKRYNSVEMLSHIGDLLSARDELRYPPVVNIESTPLRNPRIKQVPIKSQGNKPAKQYSKLRPKAFSYLDENPNANQTVLASYLKCSSRSAHKYYHEWHTQRKSTDE